ncbi:MAG: endonuclease III [Bryobacterales bacterium]|nr:endonuclease III [Bryobacteraceae bacterium]MDW8129219.1 endonuclease III [Bryobacterales bacterium]
MPRRAIAKPRTAEERNRRVKKILAILERTYPDATTELAWRTPWELLVATILSAQCTDKRVNEVTPALFAKYPTVEDFAAANQAELARDIRPTGFFNNKARALIGAARKIVADFGGEVPRTMEQMLTLPGCARKTANVVLGTAYGIPSGIAVDTHVERVAKRLDLTREKSPEKIEQDLIKIVPRQRWIRFSHQMILHGRYVCTARRPRCSECALESLCYAPDKCV